MVGDERENAAAAKDDEPDVEAHKRWHSEDAPADKKDDGDDDTPDVEAHAFKR